MSQHNDRALLVLWGDVQSNEINKDALNDWWTNEHLPERLSIPGFVRARRYCAEDESGSKTNYLTLYDVENLSVLTSVDYMKKLNNPTAGTRQHIPTLATMHRSACKIVGHQTRPELSSLGSTVGTTMVMIVAEFSDEKSVLSWAESAISTFATLQGHNKSLMSCSIAQEDPEYTEPGSSSQSYSNITLRRRDAGGVKAIALVEFSTPMWSSSSIHSVTKSLLDTLDSRASEQEEVHCTSFGLMCVVNE